MSDTLPGMVDKLSRELKSAKHNIDKLTEINEKLLSQQTTITQKAIRWLMLYVWGAGQEQVDGRRSLVVKKDDLINLVPLLELSRQERKDGDLEFCVRRMTQEEYDRRLEEAKTRHLDNIEKQCRPKIIT